MVDIRRPGHKYAGSRRSMQTTDSLPLISSVKYLLERLMTLKGPSQGCYSEILTASWQMKT